MDCHSTPILSLKQKQNQLHESRKELGSFCAQYGHDTLVTQSRKHKQIRKQKTKAKHYIYKKTFIQEKMIK
jgi:hypothetical protein